MLRTIRTLAMTSLLVCMSITSACAHAGHTVWGAWSFDWEVKDGAGLAIRNVVFENKYVLYKASMPVIRVQYDNNQCGPFADRIDWGSLDDISNCNGAKVCQQSYTQNGRNWLELGVLAEIGSYRLYQVWYFSHDGWIDSRLWSRGLQCRADHRHHPYWRFDFDIDGAPSDQFFVFDNNRPNEGWGPGWRQYTSERDDLCNAGTDRKWFVRDQVRARGAWLMPDPAGSSDDFSNMDVAVRRYHLNEDEPWPFGATGELEYGYGESVSEKDNVVWYISHLSHHASEGGDQWHAAGPNIFVGH